MHPGHSNQHIALTLSSFLGQKGCHADGAKASQLHRPFQVTVLTCRAFELD